MPDESIEQTLARLRAEHVPLEADPAFCSSPRCWARPCDTARLLEHIEGLQAALRDTARPDVEYDLATKAMERGSL